MTISEWVTVGTFGLAGLKFGWDGYVYLREERSRPLEIARREAEMRARVQQEQEDAHFVWSATLAQLDNRTALEIQQLHIEQLQEELRQAHDLLAQRAPASLLALPPPQEPNQANPNQAKEPDKWHKPHHQTD